MKQIQLKNSQVFALLDDEDYDRIFNYGVWRLDGDSYAATEKHTKMHTLVTIQEEGKEPDHINGVRTDNRKENLRMVTRSQNLMNKGMQSNNSTGYKGVCWHTQNQKWHVRVTKQRKTVYSHFFSDIHDAAEAYNTMARVHFGEYAKLNIIERPIV